MDRLAATDHNPPINDQRRALSAVKAQHQDPLQRGFELCYGLSAGAYSVHTGQRDNPQNHETDRLAALGFSE
jgi:hypothetical protein